MTLYTNSTPKETVRNAFYNLSAGVKEIYLASPFFSYDSLIIELLERNILLRLIVRLGPRTSPGFLKKLINKEGIQIRFFTSSEFHSKLYIFGDEVALIGSANLTDAGLQSNREICIEISGDDDRFDRHTRQGGCRVR
jgi:phosphatidylserine/phosphatidylglycerophosphate/cardiolipin synthase-like enzyme